MTIAPIPANEHQRLEALASFQILDSAAESEFDDIATLAAIICGTPMGVIILIDADRQWFKAHIGIDTTETSRDVAFCAHAILNDEILLVPDALEDDRFANNPLVTEEPTSASTPVPRCAPATVWDSGRSVSLTPPRGTLQRRS